MQPYTIIVVGVDFTTRARHALREAVRLAGPDGHVHVVHVVENQVMDDLREVLEAAAGFEHDVLTEASVRLGDMIRTLDDEAGPAIHVEVASGSPAQQLVDQARKHQANLLVMARNSTSDPSGGAGTFAVQCVRHSTIDVLLVRDAPLGPYRNIMACIDFSADSNAAAERAASLALRDGARLHLVHAFRPPWEVVPFAAVPMAASGDYQTEHLTMLEGQLREARQALAERYSTVPIETHLEPAGAVGSTLVSAAEALEADLVVVGSHGRGRIERLLLGSTAERVIRNSACSVLTVKHEARPAAA